MNPTPSETSLDTRVARLIDANLDRAREGLRVVEDWCRFGLEQQDLVVRLKDWRQRLGRLHHDSYKQARSTSTDTGAGLEHPAQLDRHSPDHVVAANCARVQEALRVLEEYGRNIDPALAAEAAVIRYGLYDLEVVCLNATLRARRRTKLQDCRLCLITTPCDDLSDRVEAALQNGVSMVQYRCKAGNDLERLQAAQQLRQLCNRFGALLIINDRVDLALAVDADGVHLGQEDMPSDVARSLLGSARLLGRSTHSIDQVHQAQQEPIDYLGFGPIHSTAVKPERSPVGMELLAQATAISQRPVFAIGGITLANLPALLSAGGQRAAVIGAIMHADDTGQASRQLLQHLDHATF
ncbi:thiamine phosphate synthase [Synechococcus sp. UW69]|uniref:thiamine phosphate synthase n=1 Tax=Synechococcus sp. UW69 TaxID=368493 RepID=UPI000E0F54A8|nr:thiamine phosphate synthase [Synechococcus sp. UW69]